MSGVGASGKASGGELEERIDLSQETDAKLEQAHSLASSGRLSESLALLGALEKRCRVGNDTPSLVRVCETSLKLCKEAGDTELLVSTLETLANRRSQKTQAVRSLVQTSLPWCLEGQYTPLSLPKEKQEDRDKLILALLKITEGKIFLEGERARLTRALSIIKEENGDVAGAADVLQEVHVETYGSLSKKEKVEFILEQMRLTLAKKDYVRAAIVAGKVSKKHLREENMEDYKVKYYNLMTIYHRHDKDAFELAKDYHAIYSTPLVQNDEMKWQEALTSAVIFAVLSPYSNEQQDMLQRLSREPNLEKLTTFHSALKLFLKKEIIQYPLQHQEEIESWPSFTEGGTDLGEYWHGMFHRRVIQHNIRVVSLYYQRIHGQRLASILKLDPAKLEKEISTMVSDGSIYARLDRPKDIIRFAQGKSPEEALTDWSTNIDKLLHLVETTSHLINKENNATQ